ncbi:hypothetical protein AVEN_92986-1 [Araneus ventricosus]|uniref:Uncharacterized protein n=1 Tax=Araneus ventricosus TaxID=182803 RepID=A0A4Y2JQA3_ARAVE|nr:hypothetical protein AVEN_92986-1 [Araneus ventricosus]
MVSGDWKYNFFYPSWVIISSTRVTHEQESNKNRTAYPKQYLATANEIAPRKTGEKRVCTVNSTFTEDFNTLGVMLEDPIHDQFLVDVARPLPVSPKAELAGVASPKPSRIRPVMWGR